MVAMLSEGGDLDEAAIRDLETVHAGCFDLWSRSGGTQSGQSSSEIFQGRPVMKKLLFVLMLVLLVQPAKADDASICDNTVQKGEAGGPFFGLGIAIMAQALAEKYCGAGPSILEPYFVSYVEENGCGSNTTIHKEVSEQVLKLKTWSKIDFARGGNNAIEMDEERADKRLGLAAEQFGGCEALLDNHSVLAEKLNQN